MLASIRSCWTVLLAWAILLELCILDDFDYLHRPENKWKVDFDMHYKQPAEDPSYTSWTTYNRILLQSMQIRKFVCMYMLTHIVRQQNLSEGGTQGPFDSYRGWGCLVRRAPSEGLFTGSALRLQEGELKQAVCVWTDDHMLPAVQSLQLLSIPAEHAFRKPSSPVTLPTHLTQWTHVHKRRETESAVQSLKQELCNVNGLKKKKKKEMVESNGWSLINQEIKRGRLAF